MQEHEIATPHDLDAALVGMTLSTRRKLWKVAAGNSPRWTDVFGAALGAVQLCYGGVGSILSDDRFYVFMLAFGVCLFTFSLWRMQQAQIDALRKLLLSFDKNQV